MTDVIPKFQNITKEELLVFWLKVQKSGIRGILRSLPSPITILNENTAFLFEVELDAEYFKLDRLKVIKPWNKINKITFIQSRDHIRSYFPKIFTNESKIFNLQNSLVKAECNKCHTKKKMTCTNCGGRGDEKCRGCNGTGRDRDDYPHNRCNGTGFHKCGTCHGKKMIKCDLCDGQGYLGEYIKETYKFIHWVHRIVLEYQSNGTIKRSHHKDLDNTKALTFNPDSLYQQIADDNHISQLKQMIQQNEESLSNEAEKLPNLIFKKVSYRVMPELTLNLKVGDRSMSVAGRGFQPIEKQRLQYIGYPLSPLRVILFLFLLILPPFQVLILTGLILQNSNNKKITYEKIT